MNYVYRNISIPYVNLVKNFTLHEAHGLDLYLNFEVESKTTNCSADNMTFN